MATEIILKHMFPKYTLLITKNMKRRLEDLIS